MVKVFYHNDPDGWCSAYWVRKHLEKEQIQFTDTDFIEMNYDKKFPMDIIKSGEKVFIVDFSVEPTQMAELMAITGEIGNITWIDHHKTAIEKYNDFPVIIKGIRHDGTAACALTWLYFHGVKSGKFKLENITTGDKVTEEYVTTDTNKIVFIKYTWEFAPLFTQYIHLWDTWQWKNEDYLKRHNIESFIVALTAYQGFSDPLGDIWNKINGRDSKDYLNPVIGAGKSMLYFRDRYGKICCDSIGKIVEFEGYRCFVCNMPKCNSEWFKSVDPSTYDILMPFYYNAQTEQFCFSLYSDKIDVSKIAVKYGGGGHFGASGFQCKQLPF